MTKTVSAKTFLNFAFEKCCLYYEQRKMWN